MDLETRLSTASGWRVSLKYGSGGGISSKGAGRWVPGGVGGAWSTASVEGASSVGPSGLDPRGPGV